MNENVEGCTGAREDLRRFLADVLVEVPCAECGKFAMTFEKGRKSASFECPGCRKRTFLTQDEQDCSIFSETRLVRLVRYARARRWFCPEHAGTPVMIVQIRTDSQDPRKVVLNYVCRRGNRFFGKRRVHAGTLSLDLMTLEAEMLSKGD
jgi:hypothetical protein